jgi:hypothetical protein
MSDRTRNMISLLIPPGCRAGLTRPDDRERVAAWSLKPADVPLLERPICGYASGLRG